MSAKKAFTVHFKDVGRDNKSWSIQTDDIERKTLDRAVIRSGALMSSNVGVEFNDDNLSGVVYAGFRTAGTFTIE